MHIAAIYIWPNSLPHIFGKNHQEITINLGGRNLYTLTGDRELYYHRPNPFYLEDIVNDGVSLFTCIVGSNGGGKSTLLKQLTSDGFQMYVIENEDDSFEIVDNLKTVHRVYYTPYLTGETFGAVGENGKDLSKTTMVRTDNHGDGALLDDFLGTHFSENMKRWIRFNHFYRQQAIPKVNLPSFEKITIRLEHFDFSNQSRDVFHDTAEQLRPVLRLLMKKIQDEKNLEERNALIGFNEGDGNATQRYFPVRFKYDLYEAALGKLVNIFERRGNRYLREGFVPSDYKQKIAELNVHGSLIWFLQNCGVDAGDRYIFDGHMSLISLIDYVVSIQSVERLTSNWLEMVVDEQEAFNIIDLYDEFNNGFNNEWFSYDTKPMFSFQPHIAVSSGEQSFLELFSTIYYHASNMRSLIGIDNYSFEPFEHLGNKVLLLLDEGDNAFHPRWRKAYVQHLRELLPIIFEGYQLQVIITSHDPLTLSDLPRNNAVFLEKIERKTLVRSSENTYTFGASIADLLKDSFFIGDGQAGDFFADIIDKVIKDIRRGGLSPRRVEEIERIVSTIDEPVMRFKLAQMLGDAIGDSRLEMQLIDQEIRNLQKRREEI